MQNKPIRRVVIVGGGTSGWMSAAVLSRSLGSQNYDITLVESDDIATVGVGEATIPPLTQFNEFLGVNENEFLSETNGAIKLGIQFVNWRSPGSVYFHPFGYYGTDMDGVPFQHFWLRYARLGGNPDYGLYNIETLAARENKFARTTKTETTPLPQVNYAYHFDAALYARYLRRYSEKRGVSRREGMVVQVNQDPESGYVTSVLLKDGRTISGDLFVDCSGFRGLLIEQTLKSGYTDWSQWLPNNRAVAAPSANVEAPVPYTRATAQEAGWHWRIPLQHRTGQGYVFCDSFISEQEATDNFVSRLDGALQADPKILKFVAGHRNQMWNKNVVAVGLASGFMEPLESTSIHLIQRSITKLVRMFPRDGIYDSLVDQYNAEMLTDYIFIRDFLVAHYKVTEREDTPYWKRNKYMDIPDSLKARLEMFARQGEVLVKTEDLFKDPSWFSVLVGQGLYPRDYHAVAAALSEEDLKGRLLHIRKNAQARLKTLPTHEDFLATHCPAKMLQPAG